MLRILCLCCILTLEAAIDVIIPCASKDQRTLEYVIDGIRKNGQDVRNIYLVSKERYSESAKWFPESKFPFSKADVARYLGVNQDYWRLGWYYQQLLKLYAPFVIPGISDYTLFLDADCIFLKPTNFLSSEGRVLLNHGTQYLNNYFIHAKRLLPEIERMDRRQSGIADHMLVKKEHLCEFFRRVEEYHGMPLWQAFLAAIQPGAIHFIGASEYELLFNFVLKNFPDEVEVRWLPAAKGRDLGTLSRFERGRYSYVCFHAYLVGIGSSSGKPKPKYLIPKSIDRLVHFGSKAVQKVIID